MLADDAFSRPLPAGGAVLNGAGECTGFITAAEWGSAETPVYLTSTLQLGRVYDSACRIELEVNPSCATDFIIPVVAECDDSFLNDARRMQVEHDDVVAAWQQAMASRGSATPPDEGAVGSGTGMSCLGFKGGIGTASRVVDGHTVAVLLMTNFGQREELVVSGVPVGRRLSATRRAGEAGRVVHRDRGHGRGCRRRIVRTTRPPGRPGSGQDRLGRPPRQRRDLHGLRHGHAPRSGRQAGRHRRW